MRAMGTNLEIATKVCEGEGEVLSQGGGFLSHLWLRTKSPLLIAKVNATICPI